MAPKLLFCSIVWVLISTGSGQSRQEDSERAQQHQTAEWLDIEAHLPKSETASAAELEIAADVLRARRFEYDALDFYRFALERGGNAPRLLNRLGMIELELRQATLARSYFLRAIAFEPKNAQLWNNAAVAEFLDGNMQNALRDYKKAIKLQKTNAIFHANLATVYFALKNYEDTRKQVDVALHYDPTLYNQKDGSGTEARIMTSTDRGRFCFELARSAAHRHDDEAVLTWLTKSAEANYDVRSALQSDSTLAAYSKDPRIALILQNARALHDHRIVATAPLPPLSVSAAVTQPE